MRAGEVEAEDGIRDRDVAGVQTCALPISQISPLCVCATDSKAEREKPAGAASLSNFSPRRTMSLCAPSNRQKRREPSRLRVIEETDASFARSEERRVGKSVDAGGRGRSRRRHTRS